MSSLLHRFVPATEWLPAYQKKNFRGDLSAGLTTAVMLIPQGMAYAMLAGLDPIIGLYASVVPVLLYAVLGTSRQLAVGPVAMVSLLVASGVGAIAGDDPTAYLAAAVMLSLVVGGMQLLMGLARLGFLTSFLSHPVLSGFTSAAALIIGMSQLKHLLGVNIPRSHHVHHILLQAVERASEVNAITLGIGVVSIVLLVGLKKVSPKFPRALAVVVLGTLAVWGFGLHEKGVAIVGGVPAGLPMPSVPAFDFAVVRELIPTALTIALVGFMESIAVAQAFARRHKYEIDADQELIGLGVANLGGAFFSAYPVTGGFSRTAVNDQAGAVTPLASIITAVVIAITLLFLTPLFYFLPKAVLAAIIMTAVFGLIDVKEVKHLWKVDRADLVLLAITFFATLSFGIEQGILTGVGASIVWFTFQTTRPHLAVLGRLPGTRVWRNIKRNPDAVRAPGILAIRMDAPFFYGNTKYLKDALNSLIAENNGQLTAIIIDATALSRIDSSAVGALKELAEDYKRRNIRLYLAGIRGPVHDVIKRGHLDDLLPPDRFPLNVDAAVSEVLGDDWEGKKVDAA